MSKNDEVIICVESYSDNPNGGRPPEWTDQLLEKEANALLQFIKRPDVIWFEQFAEERGYPAQYLAKFAELNNKFKLAFQRAHTWQKNRLISKGLTKDYCFQMCALLMGHEYKIYPKSESKISGDAQSPLSMLINEAQGKSKDLIQDDEESSS